MTLDSAHCLCLCVFPVCSTDPSVFPAPSQQSPAQQPPPELRHVTSTTFRSPKRASQMLRTSDARLGSRSPGSIPSSPTSVYVVATCTLMGHYLPHATLSYASLSLTLPTGTRRPRPYLSVTLNPWSLPRLLTRQTRTASRAPRRRSSWSCLSPLCSIPPQPS